MEPENPTPETETETGAEAQPGFSLWEYQLLSSMELMRRARASGLVEALGLERRELLVTLLLQDLGPGSLGRGRGILDVHPEGFAFLRSLESQLEPGPDDIYVSHNQVRSLRLKSGHFVEGLIRPPRKGERYFCLIRVDRVQGQGIGRLWERPPFQNLTPLLPQERLLLGDGKRGSETGTGGDEDSEELRILDRLAPLGKGHRILVHAPPDSGRLGLLARLARGIRRNHPELHLITLLLDQRPEERSLFTKGQPVDDRSELLCSTFDQPSSRHTNLAELVRQRAQRLVEAGEDVLLLLDSLTRLTRAHNMVVPHSGKIIAAGLDAQALRAPKEFFAMARNTEEGGSLTVIATLLRETDSPLDAAIAEEFAGRANAEIYLHRGLAEAGLRPALDLRLTATRREDLILPPGEQKDLAELRRRLRPLSAQEALAALAALSKLSGPGNRPAADVDRR